MKKIFLPILLSASLLLPFTTMAERRGNNHRQSNRTENTNSGRPGNNSRPNNNSSRPGNSNRPGNNNRPGGNNNKPGGNNNRPGNNNNKPGNNGNYRPDNRPGNNNHGNHKPDHGNKPGNHKPGHNQGWGNSHNHPGGEFRPGHHGPGYYRPSGSVNPPGYRPGPGYHHPPRLAPMVRQVIGPGRYDRVWMVGPGQYAVRFFNNGFYYMQYIWPETGRYGTPFRVIMTAPGEWYAYGAANQWYYDDGNSLYIYLNGSYQTPWSLIPSVELNIRL